MICPSCNKKAMVFDAACANCLFLGGDEEQALFKKLAHELFQEHPSSKEMDLDFQISLIVCKLPYVDTYKAKYVEEIKHFVGKAIKEVTGPII